MAAAGAVWTILDRSVALNTVKSPILNFRTILTILPNPNRPLPRYHAFLLAIWWLLGGCSTQEEVLLVEDVKYFEGAMPADFSGSWARDYARGDDVNVVYQKTMWALARRRDGGGSTVPRASQRDQATLVPIARLAELITRPDELTISQSEHEILVERRDDFSLHCAFYDGIAKSHESPFGKEYCGWEGDRLISVNDFPDGLRVVHQFHTSEDRTELRVITTVSSDEAPLPFTIRHFYRRFEKPPGKLECIETLSMKRVCSTGELVL